MHQSAGASRFLTNLTTEPGLGVRLSPMYASERDSAISAPSWICMPERSLPAELAVTSEPFPWPSIRLRDAVQLSRRVNRRHVPHGSEVPNLLPPIFARSWTRSTLVQSFSAKGRPYDNAVIECFFKYLKKEELNRRHFQSAGTVKAEPGFLHCRIL